MGCGMEGGGNCWGKLQDGRGARNIFSIKSNLEVCRCLLLKASFCIKAALPGNPGAAGAWGEQHRWVMLPRP